MSRLKDAYDNQKKQEYFQRTIKEKEAKRILGKDTVTAEEIEKVFEVYGEDDLFSEYLVNGAVLTCEQSTRQPKDVKVRDEVLDFRVTDNGITAGSVPVDNDKVLGKLIVTQTKRAEIRSEKHATTVDYCYDRNIPSFGNCKNLQYNDSEKEKLLEGSAKDKTHGNCKYLISITDEWEDEDLQKSPLQFDTRAGMKDGLTMTNMVFCSHGGWIYPVTSGQSDFDVGGIDSYITSCLDAYINGTLSEKKADIIIRLWASNQPPIAQIGKLGVQGEEKLEDEWEKKWTKYWKDDKYDPYIKAWTYYWNKKRFPDGDMTIRPEVVKAMIMDESTWGTGTTQNAGRDVIQVLYPGDYALWILSGYDPTKEKMYHEGETEPAVVWVKDGKDYKNASMRITDYDPMYGDITQTEHAGFKNGLGILRENRITVISQEESKEIQKLNNVKNSEGEYLIHYDRVTPNMSIACGVGYLAYNMEEGKSEEEGVRRYNNGGKEKKTGIKDAYVIDINEHLDHLVTRDGEAVERLQK